MLRIRARGDRHLALLPIAGQLLIAAECNAPRVEREAGARFTVRSDDVQAIADAITSACAMGRDGLHRLGAQGRNYDECTFSVEQGVTRIEALLQQAAATRRSK